MARKSFVIQLQDIAKQPILKEYLLAHGAFKKHYDGWEHTMRPNKTVRSTRLYFHNIKKHVLCGMVRHLQTVKERLGISVRVRIQDFTPWQRVQNRVRLDDDPADLSHCETVTLDVDPGDAERGDLSGATRL